MKDTGSIFNGYLLLQNLRSDLRHKGNQCICQYPESGPRSIDEGRQAGRACAYYEAANEISKIMEKIGGDS